MRVGIGQDSHRFVDGKELILAGKVIFGHKGLFANSDGDVIYHSLCNAIGSAAGFGSISTYADKMFDDGIKDSSKYLEHIYKEIIKKDYSINNISITIECSTPRIEPHVEDMKKNISKILKIKKDMIGITATSGEGLTEFGKGNGIQAISIVSLK